MTIVRVEGLDEYHQAVEDNKEAKDVFALFTGKVDPATGSSWCPDCEKADPVIERCLEDLPKDAVFIHCTVGDRPSWKDPNNGFRTHTKLRLTSVPTLIKVGGSERLVEGDCAKEDLVKMLFSET